PPSRGSPPFHQAAPHPAPPSSTPLSSPLPDFPPSIPAAPGAHARRDPAAPERNRPRAPARRPPAPDRSAPMRKTIPGRGHILRRRLTRQERPLRAFHDPGSAFSKPAPPLRSLSPSPGPDAASNADRPAGDREAAPTRLRR